MRKKRHRGTNISTIILLVLALVYLQKNKDTYQWLIAIIICAIIAILGIEIAKLFTQVSKRKNNRNCSKYQ